MITYKFHSALKTVQDHLYMDVRNFAKHHKTLGRCIAIPVALVDVTLETLRLPLQAIEDIAMTAINLIGKVFSSPKCHLKHALMNIERSLMHAADIPIAVVMAPFKLLYQSLAIVIKPEEALPFRTLDYHNDVIL